MSTRSLRRFEGHRTRVIATLGPASWSPAVVERLVEAGATAFRLNFSHGSHDDHRRAYETVRRIERKLKTPLAILQDLPGPKIRTGELEGEPFKVAPGEIIVITPTSKKSHPGVIATNYKAIVTDVNVGDRILIDDGRIEFVCRKRTKTELHCEVRNGGLIRSRKGINLPGVAVSAPALTAADRRHVRFGLELGVDFIALSFVRSAADIRQLQRLVKREKGDVAIIAKIERPEAVDDVHQILETAEGIMVARGDLGVEVESHRVPIMQKEIIAAARERGRVVVTATEMLDSMMRQPRATRAETSDVANAILDGTDAVMLSGETAVGSHPVEAVETMATIASYTEKTSVYERSIRELELAHGRDIADATVHAACTAAREIGAKAILAFTSSARTGFKISFARPKTRIIGVTFTDEAFRRLALCWGVHPVKIRNATSVDELYYQAERIMLENGFVQPGDRTVVITGSNVGGGGTNTIKIHEAGRTDMTDDPAVKAKFEKLHRKLDVRLPKRQRQSS